MLLEDTDFDLNYPLYAALKKESDSFQYKVFLVEKLKEKIANIEWESKTDECMKMENIKSSALTKLIDEGIKSKYSVSTINKLKMRSLK